MPKCILTEQGGKGGGGINLLSIYVKTPPSKLSYVSGETFSTDGLVIMAQYGTAQVPIAEADVTAQCTFNPMEMKEEVILVTATYRESGTTVTCEITGITVKPGVLSITVTGPTKKDYEYGDTLDERGLVVTAHYSNGHELTVTAKSVEPKNLNRVDSAFGITVTYEEDGITRTTTFTVNVERKQVTKPTWKLNLTYDGQPKTVINTSFWNDYNESYMSIGGVTTMTEAGVYGATFTPGHNYRWLGDKTTGAITVNWTIDRAVGQLTANNTTINLGVGKLSDTITIDKHGSTGTISASQLAGVTVGGLTGLQISFTGDGYTPASGTITLTMALDKNYTQATLDINVTVVYWSFGEGNGEEADAAWFAGLKSYLQSNTGTSIGEIVGKTKTVTLSTAVLGTTKHLIRVIGVDLDADNTVTFLTANNLKDYTQFHSSSVKWSESVARQKCLEYYNAFPGKESIKTVKKGTCEVRNSGRSGTATYSDETVWLPSEMEMGLDNFSSISKANATENNGECTQGKKFSYSYYTSDSLRIKKMGDDGSAYYYWERGAAQDGAYVCDVYTDGRAVSTGPNDTFGLAPALVIG